MDYTNGKELNEDHFSTDQVSQIKACQDESVKSFYKKYLQAEATGDTESADRYAGIITKRCNLLGVFAKQTESAPAEPGRSMYEAWEEKMKNAGATKISENDASSIAYKRHGVDTYILGEFDRLTDSEVFESFRTSPTYKKYTGEGDSSALDLWKEYVLAEGATDLKKHGKDLYAYLGESRIGKFTVTSPIKKVKSFGELLTETMTIDVAVSPDGNKSLFAQADSDDANYLADILRNAGVGGWAGGSAAPMDVGMAGLDDPMSEPVDGIDAGKLGAEFADFDGDVVADFPPEEGEFSEPEFGLEEEFANEPNEKYVDAETQLVTMSGGLNKPHQQINPNNPGDNPLAMKKLGKTSSPSLNLEESLMAEYQAFTVSESTKLTDKIADAKAKIKKLSAQKKGVALSPDVDKQLKNAKAELEKLKKQKGSGVNLYGESTLADYANTVVKEDVATEGNIGDDVIIVGNTQFKGKTGVIAGFSEGRFVVVDLYNHGKHSFHTSDVALNDYADSEEERSDIGARGDDEFDGRSSRQW